MRNLYSAFLALMLGAVPGLAAAQAPQAGPGDRQEQEAVEPGEEIDAGAVEAGPEDLSSTGDGWVDAQLVDIGRYGRRYRDAFIDELVRYRDAPRALVVELLEQRGWEPGDVYFACSLAAVAGRSCRSVVDRRDGPVAIGWSALAGELEAGAGSEAFGRIKRGIVHSYGRWARPLELDAELAAAFPDHGYPPPDAVEGEG